METSDYDFEQEPRVRPTFLTVLCILTFIGSGWSIITSASSYFTAEKTVKTFSTSFGKNGMDSLAQGDSTRKIEPKDSAGYNMGLKIGKSVKAMLTVDKIKKKSLGDFIAGLFTLGGALLMWRLKRKGFYLYIVGIAIGIALPFYLYGNDLLTIGISSFGAFFGLLFIALYAVNIKSMYND